MEYKIEDDKDNSIIYNINYKYRTHIIFLKFNYLILAGEEKFRAIALSHIRN